MAKKQSAGTETKTGFLRKVLTKNPDLDHRQVNRLWTRRGHAGQISNALFYQVRAKLGIKTEWVWVKEGEPVAPESEPLETNTAGDHHRSSGRGSPEQLAPYPRVVQALRGQTPRHVVRSSEPEDLCVSLHGIQSQPE